MSLRSSELHTFFSAKATTGIGITMNVDDYQHVILQFSSALNANATIKAVGSISDDSPDFTAAQTAANHFDFVDMIETGTGGTSIAGATGLILTGTDRIINLVLNVEAVKHLNMKITARSAGSITIKARGYNNR